MFWSEDNANIARKTAVRLQVVRRDFCGYGNEPSVNEHSESIKEDSAS